MIKFIRESEHNDNFKVEISVSNDSTLDELFDVFKGFLQACTYSLESNDRIDIVNDENNNFENVDIGVLKIPFHFFHTEVSA